MPESKYMNLEMLLMSGDDAVQLSVSAPVSVRSRQSVAAGEIAARSKNSRSLRICIRHIFLIVSVITW